MSGKEVKGLPKKKRDWENGTCNITECPKHGICDPRQGVCDVTCNGCAWPFFIVGNEKKNEIIRCKQCGKESKIIIRKDGCFITELVAKVGETRIDE